MKKVKFIFAVFALGCFYVLHFGEAYGADAKTAAVSAPVRQSVTPVRKYMSATGVQDRFFPDFVVEFQVPANATDLAVYSTSTGIESSVLAFSLIDIKPPANGVKLVKVIAGYRARKCSSSYNPFAWNCNYGGTVDQWGNTLRLRFYY